MCNAQWRVAVVAKVVDAAAQLAQGVNQVANRALVHARHAAQLVFANQQGQRSHQWAHGSAGIAKEK